MPFAFGELHEVDVGREVGATCGNVIDVERAQRPGSVEPARHLGDVPFGHETE